MKHKAELEKKDRILFWNNLAGGAELVLAGESPDRTGLARELQATDCVLPESGRPRCFGIVKNLRILSGVDRDQKNRCFVQNLRSKKDRKMDVKRLKRIAQTILAEK